MQPNLRLQSCLPLPPASTLIYSARRGKPQVWLIPACRPFWASSTVCVPCCLCRRMRWCLQSFHGNQLPCELRGVPFCDSRANAECHVQLCSFAVGKLLGLLRQRLPDPIGHLQWQQRHYCRQLIVCQLWCYASDLPSLRPANMCRNCDSSRASDGTSDHRRALYGHRRVLDEWGERCDLVFTSDGPLADNAPNQPLRAERPRTAVPRPRESDTAIEC